ncbi:hypothetical protein [Ferrimonas balearica]|uniref:hypothetical protein n=1 Tax=Ferrimonas balearica TaxID=44012 RepID=UPI001C9A055E|nr:hypothetical protein [Ferrimonas balearica]MBY5991816.1 hypothetical protein [Ferrimonas balearica]
MLRWLVSWWRAPAPDPLRDPGELDCAHLDDPFCELGEGPVPPPAVTEPSTTEPS